MRGPAPLPTKILAARGSWKAQLRKNEPEIAAAIPDPPTWLSDQALQHWHDIAPLLLGPGLIAPVYSVAFAMLCDLVAEYIDVSGECMTTPRTELTEDGGSKVSAVHRHRMAVREQLCKVLCQFGLTPSSIARVKALEQVKDDVLSTFTLKKHG